MADSSPLLPDLTHMTQTYDWLLMAYLGANFPDTAYDSHRARGTRLAAEDTSRDAMRQRAIVSSHRDWMRAHRARTAISHQWRQLFREWDVVLCPVLPTPAFPHDDREIAERRIEIDGQSIAYGQQAQWGLPATVMPVGLGRSGLPIGVQIVGPHLEDRTTLAFAELAEREFGGYRVPPGFA